MEGFELLIIAIFVLLSILEGVLGKKRRESRKEDAPGPSEDDGAEPAEPWWAEPEAPESEAPSSSEVLVPEDIWEEITGERLESRGEPARAGGAEERGDEGDAEDEERTPAERVEALRYGESGERRAGAREEVRPEAADASGEAISLEALEIDSEARHRRFHRRYLPSVRAGGAAYGAPRGPGGSRLREELDLRSPGALRRAVLYREILGPPKAIRDDEIAKS